MKARNSETIKTECSNCCKALAEENLQCSSKKNSASNNDEPSQESRILDQVFKFSYLNQNTSLGQILEKSTKKRKSSEGKSGKTDEVPAKLENKVPFCASCSINLQQLYDSYKNFTSETRPESYISVKIRELDRMLENRSNNIVKKGKSSDLQQHEQKSTGKTRKRKQKDETANGNIVNGNNNSSPKATCNDEGPWVVLERLRPEEIPQKYSPEIEGQLENRENVPEKKAKRKYVKRKKTENGPSGNIPLEYQGSLGYKRKSKNSNKSTSVVGENAENVSSGAGFLQENEEILIKNEGFPTEQDDFLDEKEDFPNKISDFPTENDDFPTENDDFPTKNEGFPNKNEDVPTENKEFPPKTSKLDPATLSDEEPQTENSIHDKDKTKNNCPLNPDESESDEKGQGISPTAGSSEKRKKGRPKLSPEERKKKPGVRELFHRRKLLHPFPCPYCSEDFDEKTSRTDHLRAVHCLEKEKSVICEDCGKLFKIIYELNRHLPNCGKVPEKYHLPPFICSVCNTEFHSYYILTMHKRTIHSDLRPLSCDQCSFTCKTHGNLSSHKNTHHKIVEKVKCPDCPKILKNRRSLKYHVEHFHTAHGAEKYKEREKIASERRKDKTKKRREKQTTICQDCNFDFETEILLKQHRKKEHAQEVNLKFQCEQCGKSFERSCVLWKHRKYTHASERPYVCDQCGQCFKTLTNLQTHLSRVHTEEGRSKFNEYNRKHYRRKKKIAKNFILQ